MLTYERGYIGLLTNMEAWRDFVVFFCVGLWWLSMWLVLCSMSVVVSCCGSNRVGW